MTDRRFQVIYADPPWTYKDRASAGQRGAAYKYPVMDTTALCRLPVPRIAAPDCALFLCVTMPMLPDGLQVMNAWGFRYKTAAFVWVKANTGSMTDFMGMGNWTRANAEIVLLGVQGKVKRADTTVARSVRQVIWYPRLKHSAKPPGVRDRIVDLMGDVPRIELFARQRVAGWAAWGNEVQSDVKLEA